MRSGDASSTKKGAQLWRSAAKKTHAVHVVHELHKNHAVHHQLQHRASEKLGFGVTEHLLETLIEATIDRHTLVHHHAAGAKALGWLAAPRRLARNATCGLRSLGPAAVRCRAPLVAAPPSLASRAWAASLDGVKIMLPCAGTVLVAHMAHHDWHRAQHERHERGRCLSTLLFVAAAAFDAADALVHAMVVLLMLAERLCDHETLHAHHLDHLEHELHHSAMLFAVCATVAMVLGEVLSARASPVDVAKKHH